MDRRLWGLVVLLVIGLLTFTGCGDRNGSAGTSQEEKSLKKFNVGYLPTPGHVLYFVAQEKGYFQEEGLDVEMFQFTNSGEGLNAVKAGKIDAGSFGTAAPLIFIAKGAEFTLFGGQQSEGAGIVAKPENADRFQDLNSFRGKTVATVRLATGDVVFRGALQQAGIDWKTEVTFQELDSPAAVLEAVKKGSVDAGVVWAPYMKMAEQQGLKIVKYSGDLISEHTCCRQVALTSKITENPEDYKKFSRALIKAYGFYQNKKTETVDMISKYVKIDKDIIEAETYGGHISSNPDPDKEGIVKFWGMMNEAGYISSDKNIKDYINTDIYSQAIGELLQEDPGNPVYKKLKSEFKNGRN